MCFRGGNSSGTSLRCSTSLAIGVLRMHVPITTNVHTRIVNSVMTVYQYLGFEKSVHKKNGAESAACEREELSRRQDCRRQEGDVLAFFGHGVLRWERRGFRYKAKRCRLLSKA